ncbi:putative DNA-directed RNA polymerase III subunit rpc6 [Astathelohania contejeani]|uniref:DNA-directed RNA polymerase III subunit rpc6 n=1 Tax=Astathelohania contejeani TaxID=164912 RepID=A0ABQ7HZW8_9MICR|nr:putative DNA-directed RNA polymerase III subunit rpc6 [Thelohania contejeani]
MVLQKILSFLESKVDGATEDQICAEFPSINKEELAKHLNMLINQKQIDIFNNGVTLCYKKSTEHKIEEEKIIYNLIKESGGKGMWLRDLSAKTHIPQNLISKLLKSLESRKQIKAVKSIKNNRKVYIAYDENPSEELTGGIFYNESNVDEEFINEMMKIIYTFIYKNSYSVDEEELNKFEDHVTIEMIYSFLDKSGVSAVKINLADLKILLKIMEYDGVVRQINNNGVIHYRAIKSKQ